MKATEGDGDADGDLRGGKEPTGDAANIARTYAKADEDETKSAGEEHGMAQPRGARTQCREPTKVGWHNRHHAGRQKTQHPRGKCREGINALHQPNSLPIS